MEPSVSITTSVLGSSHHVFDFANAAHYRAEGDKFGMRAPRDQSRKRGLAATGRSPEDHRAVVVSFNGSAQGLSRAKQRLLPGKFFERARTHAFGKRRAGGSDFGFHFGEKAHGRLAHYVKNNRSAAISPDCGTGTHRQKWSLTENRSLVYVAPAFRPACT